MKTHHRPIRRAVAVLVASVIAGACTAGGVGNGTDPSPTSLPAPTSTTQAAPESGYFDPVSWDLTTPVNDFRSRGSIAGAVTVGDNVVMVGEVQSGADGSDRRAAMWLGTPNSLALVPGEPFGALTASVAAIDAIGIATPVTAQLMAVGAIGDNDGIRGVIWELAVSNLVANPVWTPVFNVEGTRFVDVVAVDGGAAVAVGTRRVNGDRQPVFAQRNARTGQWGTIDVADVPVGDIAIVGLTVGASHVVAALTVTVDGQSRPVVWVSGDAGHTWRFSDLPAVDDASSVASVGFGAGHFLVAGYNGRREGVIWSSATTLQWDATPALYDGAPAQGVSFGSMVPVSITPADGGSPARAVLLNTARDTVPYRHFWLPGGEQITDPAVSEIEEHLPAGPALWIDAPISERGFWIVNPIPGGFVITAGNRQGGPGAPLPDGGPRDMFSRVAVTDGSLLITGSTALVQMDTAAGVARGRRAGLYLTELGTFDTQQLSIDEAVTHIADVVATETGGFVAIGSATSDTDLNDVWVARLDSTGSFIGAVTFGGSGVQNGDAVIKVDDRWLIVGYSHRDFEPSNAQARVWSSTDLVSWTEASAPVTTSGSRLTGACMIGSDDAAVFGSIRGDDLIRRPAAWRINGDGWSPIDLGVDAGSLYACSGTVNGLTLLGWDGTNSVVWSGSAESLTVAVFDVNEQPSLMVEYDNVAYLIGRRWIADRWQPGIWVGINNLWQPINAPKVDPFITWELTYAVFTADEQMLLFGRVGDTPAVWTGAR
jgi:hypothetical protein